jgi:hypothetical protein
MLRSKTRSAGGSIRAHDPRRNSRITVEASERVTRIKPHERLLIAVGAIANAHRQFARLARPSVFSKEAPGDGVRKLATRIGWRTTLAPREQERAAAVRALDFLQRFAVIDRISHSAIRAEREHCAAVAVKGCERRRLLRRLGCSAFLTPRRAQLRLQFYGASAICC